MVELKIVSDAQGQSPPIRTFPVRTGYGALLSERMGLPKREVPPWARNFDWTAEDDDDE